MTNEKQRTDRDDDNTIAFWTMGEKKRTLIVVQRYEERTVILHAIKRTLQIITGIMSFLIAFKMAGLGMYWSNFVTWMAQK